MKFLFIISALVFTFSCNQVKGQPFILPVIQITSGSVTASVDGGTVVDVTVSPGVTSYTIGGSLAQLAGGNTVVLQNNAGDNLSLNANGSFTFGTSILSGSTYAVSVFTQPSGQNCIVSSPSGTVASANITSIIITCTGNASGALSSGTIINALPTLGAGGVVTFVGSPCANNTTCASGSFGFTDSVTPANVRFSAPSAITTDGYNLYIADRDNHAIRKVVISTGVTTTLAGSTAGTPGFLNGIGTAATFNNPRGITTDGVFLFVADSSNNAIRKVNIATGDVTTIISSGLNTPRGMTIYNNNLYISDSGAQRLFQFNLSSLALTTVISAGLNNPRGIILSGSDIYISDYLANKILKTTIGIWTLSDFATGLNNPDGITTDGTSLFVVQEGIDTLSKITMPGAVVTTLAGDGTAGYINSSTSTSARFDNPRGITSDGSSVYVVDRANHTIRKVN